MKINNNITLQQKYILKIKKQALKLKNSVQLLLDFNNTVNNQLGGMNNTQSEVNKMLLKALRTADDNGKTVAQVLRDATNEENAKMIEDLLNEAAREASENGKSIEEVLHEAASEAAENEINTEQLLNDAAFETLGAPTSQMLQNNVSIQPAESVYQKIASSSINDGKDTLSNISKFKSIENTALQTQIQYLTSKIVKLGYNINTLQSTKEESDKKLLQLAAELEKLNEDYTELKKKHDELLKELAQIKADERKAKEMEANKPLSSTSSTGEDSSKPSSDTDAARQRAAEINKLKARIRELENSIKEKEAELEKKTRDYEFIIANQTDEIKALQALTDDMNENLKSLTPAFEIVRTIKEYSNLLTTFYDSTVSTIEEIDKIISKAEETTKSDKSDTTRIKLDRLQIMKELYGILLQNIKENIGEYESVIKYITDNDISENLNIRNSDDIKKIDSFKIKYPHINTMLSKLTKFGNQLSTYNAVDLNRIETDSSEIFPP